MLSTYAIIVGLVFVVEIAAAILLLLYTREVSLTFHYLPFYLFYLFPQCDPFLGLCHAFSFSDFRHALMDLQHETPFPR